MADTTTEKRKRKEEGKLKKRQRIEEAGGVRPRDNSDEKNKPKSSHVGALDTKPSRNGYDGRPPQNKNTSGYDGRPPQNRNTGGYDGRPPQNRNTGGYDGRPPQNKNTSGYDGRPPQNNYQNKNTGHGNSNGRSSFSRHRFGRVMESVPCRNKPRFSTLSIALPGSVLANCQTRELRTLLVGSIARAATIYHVDEIIVFDDKLGKSNNNRNSSWRDFKRRMHGQDGDNVKKDGDNEKKDGDDEGKDGDSEKKTEELDQQKEERFEYRPRSTHEEFMARLLQYCECPQYLRRVFFPMHPDLQFAGLLAPVDAPHHVRQEDRSKYREGVVMKKKSPNGNFYVNCGIRNRPVEIDRKLTPGIRCTVQIDPSAYGKASQIRGVVVSPSAPREDDGTYWGFTTRMADSINSVFENCPFSDTGYDLKIGTSERGSKSVEDNSFGLPKFRHSLLVFGGVAGIEECVDADETIKIPGSSSSKLFDLWLNTCPFQGSRTIRTEEAVMISLAKINPFLIKSSQQKAVAIENHEDEDDEFSDESPSDESSEEEVSSEEE